MATTKNKYLLPGQNARSHPNIGAVSPITPQLEPLCPQEYPDACCPLRARGREHSSDECGPASANMDTFSTKNLALQAQKKLLSKMASKTMASVFIDDTSSEVLDELYRVTKEFTRNRKEAQKIIKDLIKIIMKLGILYRNGQFSPEELVLMERFRKKVHHLAMTAVSFYQIDFTFDRRVMATTLHECRDLLHQAVNTHLTSKSHSRINHVFNHFADFEFLAALYGPSEPYRSHLRRICDGINKMLDEDSI